MQFRTIRTAFDHESNVVHASKLSPHSRATWLCRSCRSALRLCRTHDNGGYFEHDLEYAENVILKHCEYLLTTLVKPPSMFILAVCEILQRAESLPKTLSYKDYICVLCNHAYYGLRKCPCCHNSLCSTEAAVLDTQTIPEKWAK
ncbi:hypothetical protein EGX47_00930 [Yersinia pseudotuberculosis]|uniref:Uncharacterized protein n=1 Tax=Yersinia pseudotuberculosis TaxID=633 RepID=A0ABM7AC82_YERPU|nr:putative zinc ribbon protein [Yersinia pseudotuberculosis]AYW90037.1 hypothetical protein EGX47_00930 [Yersinia pseudotuberculosis]MBO1632477.1 hypothetical protein [Yersinia pseudotuberculosis]MBP0072153.1 hypothetical protein [Yersinia pseudotuberculosis]